MIPSRSYGARLTVREREILQLIAEGLQGKQVAACVAPSARTRGRQISHHTVSSHMGHIYMKLGAVNNAHAVALAHARGDLELTGDGTYAAPELTRDERCLLELIANGLSYPQIAKRMGIGIGSVSTHHVALYETLGAANQPHAVQLAIRYGLVAVNRRGMTCR